MAGKIEILNPPGLGPAQGLYSQATHVPADVDTFHIAGQLAVGKDGSLIGVGDFDAQFHQVYGNLGDVLLFHRASQRRLGSPARTSF